MTIADTTRGALRREGEAIPDAGRDAGLDERVDRMLALGVGAGPVGNDDDAVGLAIEAHRSARATLSAACNPADSVWVEQNGGDASDEAMAPARAAHDAASDAEAAAWDALLETRPSDAAGLLRMLRYVASAGPMEALSDAREFGRNIAEAAETALAQEAPEEVDWYDPPPGFMAYPAIEPGGFIRIRHGIVAELQRLRGIARAEYARREPLFDKAFGLEEREARLLALRDDLRLSALDAAIADPKASGAAVSVTGPDPIFAAIEASRAAQTAVETWSAAADTRWRPMPEAEWKEEERLTDALWDAQEVVANTVPITAAGRLALLEWLRWQMGLYSHTDGTPPDQHSAFWRFAYKALKAAMVSKGPAAARSVEAGADAELIALGHAFDIATVRDREATAAEARAEARMPERPASLFFRVEDAPFCLREHHSHPDALAGQSVTPLDLGWMTRRPAEHEVWVDAPPGSKGSNMVSGKVPQIVPWPEAQARIDEIEAAFKVWDREKDRILEEEGSWDADEAADRAGDRAADLAQQIIALPAQSLDGMRVKLRVAAFYGVCDLDTQVDAGYPGEAAIRSLYRDTPGIVVSTDPSDIRIVPEVVGGAEPALSLSDEIIVGWREWAARPDLDETEAGEAEFERLSILRNALIDAAEMLPPAIENLPAKALALAWVTYADLWQHGRARSEYGTDGQLMLDIDTAICGRLKTHYARAEA